MNSIHLNSIRFLYQLTNCASCRNSRIMQKFEFSLIILVMFLSVLIAGTAGLQQESTPDYYKTLELSEDCSQEDVKKAFRRLARKYHPDKCKEPDAQEKFQKIGEGTMKRMFINSINCIHVN